MEFLRASERDASIEVKKLPARRFRFPLPVSVELEKVIAMAVVGERGDTGCRRK
jgi:hypothetical protein